MAAPSYTYSLVNGASADASQVMQNYNDILNGVTDGTKDLSISSLTCAGTVTLNGDLNIGNATSDTLLITSSLGSSIGIKTTNSYDIGASTLALRSIYLASADSAARATRVMGGTVGSNWTLTLPTAVPTQTGQTVISDASGTTSFRYKDKVVSKTTTYGATGDETHILCSGSAFTVTLPAAASFTNKEFVIVKTDSSLTNIITVKGNGAELINAANTTTLNTIYESVRVICDGTQWYVVERCYSGAWGTGIVCTMSAGFGTTSAASFASRRVGDSLEFQFYFVAGTSAASVGYLQLPSGYTIDTTKMSATASTGMLGIAFGLTGTLFTAGNDVVLFSDGSTNNQIYFSATVSANAFAKTNVNAFGGSNIGWSGRFTVPISGWSA